MRSLLFVDPMASLNQAIIENEANSVVRQRMLTNRAKDENSLACRKKCLHNLSGRCNANVCSFHQKAAFFRGFLGILKVCQGTVSLHHLIRIKKCKMFVLCAYYKKKMYFLFS